MYRCNKDLDISGTILRNTTARIDMRILFPTRSIRNESYAFLETSQRQATCTPRKYSQLDYQFIPLRHGVKFRSFINSKLSGNLVEESIISDLSVSFITWNIQRFSKNRKRLLVETKKRNGKRKDFHPPLPFSLSLATPFPSLCFVEHSTNNRPTPVAQYNDILLEGIPRRASTCLHPPRMKLSREVAYKYITIRTQYSIPSYWPSRSDFPFSRLKGIPLCVHAYVCAREEGQGVRCLHTGRRRGGGPGKI